MNVNMLKQQKKSCVNVGFISFSEVQLCWKCLLTHFDLSSTIRRKRYRKHIQYKGMKNTIMHIFFLILKTLLCGVILFKIIIFTFFYNFLINMFRFSLWCGSFIDQSSNRVKYFLSVMVVYRDPKIRPIGHKFQIWNFHHMS